MYWQVSVLTEEETRRDAPSAPAGRFVLHRHHDADGPHLDLRLEQDGYLMGWRIAATALEGAPFATVKAPHPVAWLDQDGDAMRVDAGTYCWRRQDDAEQEIELHGHSGVTCFRVCRVAGLRPDTVQAVRAALGENAEEDAARLIEDGLVARRRALARFCGLGRELDDSAFDEATWRQNLAGCSLEVMHAYLRAYEVRFDRKYPPLPVSTPEPLGDEADDGGARGEAALAILRG